MTREELAKCDGRDGRPAYVAVNGNIYDFTTSKLWTAGNHQTQHQAGADLTAALATAPHVRAVIERFPVVGRLEEAPEAAKAGWSKAAMVVGALFVLGVIVLLLLLR